MTNCFFFFPIQKISDKNFKKVSQLCIGAERIFEFIDVPYREIHPNATPKEYLTK